MVDTLDRVHTISVHVDTCTNYLSLKAPVYWSDTFFILFYADC